MSTISNEQFLFSCIKHSNGGTVNWEAVAKECGIVSKGAAAIKYKRMKDKFGDVSDGATKGDNNDGGNNGETPKKTKKPAAKKHASKESPAKKRKMDSNVDDDDTPIKAEDDDDEDV